jgi:hypothetical protein
MREAVERAGAEAATLLDEPVLQRQIDRARDQIENLDTRARKLIKDQPLTVLGGVLLLGYAFGWLLSRR